MSSGIKKHNAPAVVNPARTIVQTVNRSVELIVASHRHHQKLARLQIDFRQRMNGEVRFIVFRDELAFSNWIRQIKAAGFTHTRVVIVEIRDDVFDVFADAIVIQSTSNRSRHGRDAFRVALSQACDKRRARLTMGDAGFQRPATPDTGQ